MVAAGWVAAVMETDAEAKEEVVKVAEAREAVAKVTEAVRAELVAAVDTPGRQTAPRLDGAGNATGSWSSCEK